MKVTYHSLPPSETLPASEGTLYLLCRTSIRLYLAKQRSPLLLDLPVHRRGKDYLHYLGQGNRSRRLLLGRLQCRSELW